MGSAACLQIVAHSKNRNGGTVELNMRGMNSSEKEGIKDNWPVVRGNDCEWSVERWRLWILHTKKPVRAKISSGSKPMGADHSCTDHVTFNYSARVGINVESFKQLARERALVPLQTHQTFCSRFHTVAVKVAATSSLFVPRKDAHLPAPPPPPRSQFPSIYLAGRQQYGTVGW